MAPKQIIEERKVSLSQMNPIHFRNIFTFKFFWVKRLMFPLQPRDQTLKFKILRRKMSSFTKKTHTRRFSVLGCSGQSMLREMSKGSIL